MNGWPQKINSSFGAESILRQNDVKCQMSAISRAVAIPAGSSDPYFRRVYPAFRRYFNLLKIISWKMNFR